MPRVIPRKFGPALFGLILSGLMSLLVSGISTFRAAGAGPDSAGIWIGSWLAAWCFAFPAVLLAGPIARKAVEHLVRED